MWTVVLSVTIVSIYKDWIAFHLVNCVECSIYFHCTLHLAFYLDFKEFRELFGSFFIFLNQRRKIGGKIQAKIQAKLSYLARPVSQS